MRIDSSVVTQLYSNTNRATSSIMPKLCESAENFVKTKINNGANEVDRCVSLELNTDNLEDIPKEKQNFFTPVGRPIIDDVDVVTIYRGDISKYLGLLNSEVSLSDIKEKGIDEFSDYKSLGKIWEDKSSIEDFFEKGADKYKEILSQLGEKYGEGSEKYEQQKGDLDIALTRYFENKIDWVHTYSRTGAKTLEEYNNSAYKANAENTAKYFIENFNKDKDVSTQLDEALSSSFPEESTSHNNISLKDYEIIRKETEANFNKGTGIDLMEKLSKNYNLSDVVRKTYEGLLKHLLNGSSSLYYNYQV